MNKRKSEQGQAIVLIAAAIFGLIGMTALAIDGGNAFSDRRHAQNAADTGVLAAALSSIRNNKNDALMRNAGLTIANANGYNNSNSDHTITIYFCNDASSDCPPPFAGSDEYIHMEIISEVKTFFASVIGVDYVTNKVDAVARVKPSVELFFGSAMISVSPTGRATYELNGGPSTVITGGGIFVNSDADPCAFEVNGGSGTFSVPSITVVGDACPDNAGGVTAIEGAPQLPPINYSWIDDAIGCASATAYNDAVDRSGSSITPHTSPLRFSGTFPPSGIDNLLPGIYCLDGDFRVNSTTAVLNGVGVTFVISTGGITLNGGQIRLSAPTTGPTAGLLFYQPIENNDVSNAATIVGNAELILTGTILAPGVGVSINGSPNTQINGQVIGDEVALSGAAGSSVNYNDSQNINAPPQIELVH